MDFKLFWGVPIPTVSLMEMRKVLPSRPTRYALGTIFFWATQALVLADRLPHLNLHIFLAFSFFIAALTLSFWTFYKFQLQLNTKTLKSGFNQTRCLLRKPYIWIGILSYFLYHYLLFRAIDIGPVVTANLLNFAWPIFFVLISERFFHSKRTQLLESWIVYTKLAVGFSGCILLLVSISTHGKNLALLFDNLAGPIIGLLAAIVWAVFTLSLKTAQTKISKKLISFSWAMFPIMATLVSIVILGIVSLLSADSLITNMAEWKKVFWPGLYFGLMPLGIAMILYDNAVRQVEEAEKLGRLLFLTPLFSTILLLLFAKTENLNMWGYLGVILIILVNMNIREMFLRIRNKLDKKHQQVIIGNNSNKSNRSKNLKEKKSMLPVSYLKPNTNQSKNGSSKNLKQTAGSNRNRILSDNLKINNEYLIAGKAKKNITKTNSLRNKISKKLTRLTNELLIPKERKI